MIDNSKPRLLVFAATSVLLLLVLLTPAVSVFAATPTKLSGTTVVTSYSLINSYTKNGKTYTTFADVFSYSGTISGTCTGTDSGFAGVGPSGGFGTFSGSCTLVGTVAGVAGTIQIFFSSPVGAEPTANANLFYTFSGTSGTGGLTEAHIVNGYVDTTDQYTAIVQFGS